MFKNSLKLDIATRFVVMIGLISLFSDMTYEAARSINGQYLSFLGTNGKTVAIVSGIGELLGFGLRFISGYIADKTKRYWLILILGYTLNLFSVPLLALAGYWQFAVILMITERIGKALRTPARDAILSFGTQQMKRGWGYGLHEALDQIGATIGPLLVSSILYIQHQNYHFAYAVLLVPAIIAMFILFRCKVHYPKPENLEFDVTAIDTKHFSKRYWIYVCSVIFIAAGYVDFPLIAFHFKKEALINEYSIPILYAIAMATDAVAALSLGKIYDKHGLRTLLPIIAISSVFAPLVFLGNIKWAVVGMILWGIGMGAQESILKAVVAEMVHSSRRGTAFGTFNAAYGLFWFLGSLAMGFLYDFSIVSLIFFSVATQITAFVIILFLTTYSTTKSK